MKCTDLLVEDHRIILRCLDVLQQMSTEVQRDQPLDAGDVWTLLRFLRVFADEYHQTKEESALFPELVLASTSTWQARALQHMEFEHEQERSLIEGLEDSLHTKKNGEFVVFANRLLELIRNHIYKEEHILFDIVDRSLTAEQDRKVVAEFDKFQWDKEHLIDLKNLERKYITKAA